MSVVRENKVVFRAEDVKLLRIRCGWCGAGVVNIPGGGWEIPVTCPLCSKSWVHDKSGAKVRYAARGLAAVLDMIQSQEGDSASLFVEFEIDGKELA